MNIEQKTTFIFNRILIDFFKEIKKDNYFKLAIKKHYKVIDKKSPKYIKLFIKKTNNNNFSKLFLDPDFNIHNLKEHAELLDINIFKNIKINKLVRTFNDDKENIMSYILILYLFSYLYKNFQEQIEDFKKNNNTDKEKCLDDDEEDNNGDGEDKGDGDDNEDDKGDEDDNDESSDDDGDESSDNDDDGDESSDNDEDEDDEVTLDDIYNEQQKFLFIIVEVLEKINKKEDITNELSEILDDEVKVLLMNINKVKVFVKLDSNIDDLIGDSKIGNLAKEISESINLDDLNIENPNDLLNPANLFGGEGGNILGNLVQQVGSSITQKLNSGEIQQDELVKDAFSLMNKMQNGSANNPIINDMMNNMMNNRNPSGGEDSGSGDNSSGNTGGMPDMAGMSDMAEMMKGMMNPDMMQQMMNSMGGTQGLHQNNPDSRENKMREKLKKKLQEKE
tara:strand:- start:7570 stop:8916 length:1347 start_codon:yes stop_codon:yes gene_type:complete